MRRFTALLILPLGLALGGCMSYGGGTTYTTRTYTYPSYTYSYPGYSYPSYSYGTPAIVSPSGSYYGPSYNVSRFDYDGDGVSNSLDRYPTDRYRW